jgi:FKBP-type peptidyl-prolyl cis-trans isomerase FkpA
MKRLFHSLAKLNRSPCSAKKASKQLPREFFSDQLLARFNEVAITVHQPQPGSAESAELKQAHLANFSSTLSLGKLMENGVFFTIQFPMKTTLAFCALSLLSTALLAAAPAETLPSGVKVTHTVDGTGANPKASDAVKVHYRGTLANGTEFDSSYKRGQPATFPLSRVVPCWTEGMQKIKVGGKATLTCPPATAYGDRGAGGVVPPNATLTFEVELLAIEK